MTTCCRLKKECEKVWKEAQQLSMAESSQASVSGERHSGDGLSSEVDIRAAAKACRTSEVPRRSASPSSVTLLLCYLFLYLSVALLPAGPLKCPGGQQASYFLLCYSVTCYCTCL